jgi:hypothetical protein
MGVQPAVFQSGGQASQHYIPGAYSRLDFQKSAGGLASINNAVIMGDSRGGEPNKVLWFTSPSQAEDVLRSGTLLDAIKHAFTPSPDFAPQRVGAMRVNPGLQASKDFTYTSAGVAEVLRLIVTHAATASEDVSIVLNGAAGVDIAVASGDTVSQVATKIAAGSFTGWTPAASGDTVTFTATAVGQKTGANTFSGGTTGVTATAGIEEVIVGVDAGDYSVISADSWDWGLPANQVKVKLEAGTTTGKKLTMQFLSETAYVADDIERESLSLQYTGLEAACKLHIDGTYLKTFTTTHTDEISIELASFPTVQDLVNYLNDQTNYTATLLALVPEDPSDELDWQEDLSLLSEQTLTSDVEALVDAMLACPWIGSENAAYAVTQAGRTMPDNIASWSYFSGGTDGAYTTSEWADSLELMEREDVQLVGCSSSSASVHALISAHCTMMNSVTGKNERQALLGGASGETVAQVIARAQALNSMAVLLAYPEFQHYNAAGTSIVWWSPVYYAAKLLGLATCLALNEPLTNKAMSVLDFKAVSPSDQELLIKGGVCAGIKNSTGQFVSVRQVTTYQGSELQKCEFSMVREALWSTKDLRNAIEATYVGRAGTNDRITEVDSTVNLKLNLYVDMGLFNGDPAYWGYQRRVNGDQIIVEYNCNLTPPLNFVFITSHMSVYASTNG